MDKRLYNITAWILIILGVGFTLVNIYANIFSELAYGATYLGEILIAGVLGSIAILLLFLAPGRYYLKLKEMNKLTNASVILILIGVVLILLSIIFMLFMCYPNCDGYDSLTVLFLGMFPALALYFVAIILLIVNRVRR